MTDPKALYDPGDQFLPVEAAGGERAGWRTWVYWAAVAGLVALTLAAYAWDGYTAAHAMVGP